MKKLLFSLCLLFPGFALFSQEPVLKELIIGDSKIACQYNNTITSCLKVKHHPDSNWREFPYTIEGFIFEPGVEVRIAIEESPVLFPEDNGPKYTYKLVKVLESRATVLDNKKLLAANRWKVINLEMDRNITPARKSGAWIIFNTDSNTISGFGGCNSFGGNTLIENGVLQFGLLTNTLLACANSELEGRIMEGLKGKAAFYIRNNMLFVVCENHLILHLRPEKKLDSLIREVNKPTPRGNTFADMQTGDYAVTLDDVKEAGNQQMVFSSVKLSETEKKTIRIKLKNSSPSDPVSMILILSKPHKLKGHYYATLVMVDGTRKTIVIRNVL